MQGFLALGLSDLIVRAVAARGYTKPTPIQSQAIPVVLSGRDLLAGAQTGTGKTAGFTLPILHLLSNKSVKRSSNGKIPIRALILTPTRELAAQVEESVRMYGRHLPLTSMAIYGGVNINPQINRLRGGVEILVATPGRLLDHVQQGRLDLSQVEVLVLDEADRMLDMGFIRDIKRILALLPKQRQNLLFSATFSHDIKTFASTLLDRPVMVEVASQNATADLVTQRIFPVDRDRKRELLTHLIQTNNWYQVLVFTRTKHGADRLVKQLHQDDIVAMAIHGNKSQAARTRALGKFKDGSLQVLVATDIAARGLDISELPQVVNYELPNVPEDYVHRIGRTGRAGSSGEAISLVCVDERKFLADIEKLIKRSLPHEIIEGFEPDPRAQPEPIQVGRQQKHQPRRNQQSDRSDRGDRGAIGKPISSSKAPTHPQKKQLVKTTVKLTQPSTSERSESRPHR
ncbi:DEAD/DEAH box helicase [Pseudanabaena sp. UWO310]|uniref:DEAD/DEAH box helicase n=1 Tax=Pseudanabaena sp. UWO310 TaxID=2480795 RepID=UPI00115A0E4F|nr:DEAD/DEAH box helicase [Pseudanabaena sp. UWO310]